LALVPLRRWLYFRPCHNGDPLLLRHWFATLAPLWWVVYNDLDFIYPIYYSYEKYNSPITGLPVRLLSLVKSEVISWLDPGNISLHQAHMYGIIGSAILVEWFHRRLGGFEFAKAIRSGAIGISR